jgi:hypothetical protein
MWGSGVIAPSLTGSKERACGTTTTKPPAAAANLDIDMIIYLLFYVDVKLPGTVFSSWFLFFIFHV